MPNETDSSRAKLERLAEKARALVDLLDDLHDDERNGALDALRAELEDYYAG